LLNFSVSLSAPTNSVLERISDVPIHFTDPIARRSAPLQHTAAAVAPTARLNAATLAILGLHAGQNVKLTQGQGSVVLPAALDAGVPAGCVRVAAGHALTAGLGDMFGSIVVERA
jgi:NADH-quinone oxidoreductase subunit G